MTNIQAIKARLSDPREVARLLGLRVIGRQRGGVMAQCPIGGGKDGSLSLKVGQDNTLQVYCFGGCVSGDVLSLLTAIEGDFKRGLARAVELAGGAVGAPVEQWQEPEKCDPDAYHELAERILEAGRLNGRAWTVDVGRYLEGRGLLELACGDGWAALPRLKWLLDLAREVCEKMCYLAYKGSANKELVAADTRASEKSGAFSPPQLLVAARLAHWGHDGRLRATWGQHRLVIPWCSPEGRIVALQRRVVAPGDGPKYVLPWSPEWPYGSEKVGNHEREESRSDRVFEGVPRGAAVKYPDARFPRGGRQSDIRDGAPLNGGAASTHFRRGPIAIVEGAVDTLALRALYPRLLVVGVPGIKGWRASWAKLLGLDVRIALDRGKPNKQGIIEEDRAAARIALDCVGHVQPDDLDTWMMRRHKAGKGLFCVLCGREEAWLCGACGRRRAPKGMDWGEVWRVKCQPTP